MTYTHKLARRLAISRNLAMLTALVLLAACAGETMAPEEPSGPTTPAAPNSPIGFRVLPGTVTVETNQPVRFRGEVQTHGGAVRASSLTWESTGGRINSDGTFSSPKPGTYRVVARGHGRDRAHGHQPDTSVVVVVPRRPGLVGIRVSPRAPTLQAGETRSFTAMGRLGRGTNAVIGVVWTATGGTIDPAGAYTAGNTPGTYRIVAEDTRGAVADTVKVTISVPTLPDTVATPTPDARRRIRPRIRRPTRFPRPLSLAWCFGPRPCFSRPVLPINSPCSAGTARVTASQST